MEDDLIRAIQKGVRVELYPHGDEVFVELSYKNRMVSDIVSYDRLSIQFSRLLRSLLNGE